MRRSDQVVDTEAESRTGLLLERLESASIGISGPQGVGKSTILQKFCTHQFNSTSEDLLILASAPTAYDRREFLVHLFIEVCRTIVGGTSFGDGVTNRRARRLKPLFPAAAVVLGVVIVALAIYWPSIGSETLKWKAHPRIPILLVGAILAIIGTVWALRASRGHGRTTSRTSGAQILATERLRELRYQLSIMRSRDEKLALPGGLEFGRSDQIQRTELTRTYPELVSQFRTVLDIVALERRGLGGRVIIGIDELDKIGSAEEAERFINDLKAIFGISGCYFLVSVSEEAFSTFGRRALAVRATLDSAFDEIIMARPLKIAQSRDVLEQRGVSMPEPYLWLCHILSGGLPRDMIRVVVSLAAAKGRSSSDQLNELACELIRENASMVLTGQIRHAYTVSEQEMSIVSDWLARALSALPKADELEDLCLAVPEVAAGSTSAKTTMECQSFLYFIATMIRIFVDGSAPIVEWLRHASSLDPIDHIAMARSELALRAPPEGQSRFGRQGYPGEVPQTVVRTHMPRPRRDHRLGV